MNRALSPHLLLLPLLAACATGRGTAAPPSTNASLEPVATTIDGPITEQELSKEIAGKPKLAKQLFDLRRDALEGMILERLVEREAARRKVSPDVLLKDEVAQRAPPPTEKEIQAYFDSRVASTGYKLADVHDQIAQQLLQEGRRQAIVTFLESLKRAAKVEILIEPPKVDVAAVGPAKGPADASVTIVEFSDFQCPYCEREEKVLRQILADFPKDVRIVFRDFPLDIHPDAQRAAQAGSCADAQGQFWAMHDKLFENQHALSLDAIKGYARAVGLNPTKFDACLDSAAVAAHVSQSVEDGERAGVDGTPALFVNGRPLTGATSYEELRAAVIRARAERRAP
ncbi:MAG: thioredoxin domain-containing protein [Deltaproteobacteria bacterium]